MTTTDSCYNCGLPAYANSDEGIAIRLRQRAENSFQRDHKRTVWCCSRSCAIQAFAISRMGPSTHNWPVSLSEFAGLHHEEIEKAIQVRLDRTEMASGTRINSGAAEGKSGYLALPYTEPINGRISVRRGRPKKWASEAERLRAYRQRAHEVIQ